MIRGNKVHLSIPTSNDWKLVQSIWEDPDTMKDVGGIHPLPEDGFKRWFDFMFNQKKDENRYFLIFENSDSNCVGEVSFHRYNKSTKTAMFNIKIIKAFRGKGYGLEAIDLMLEYYFNTWNGVVMEDSIWIENVNGLAILKRYGFIEKRQDKKNIWLEYRKENWRNNPTNAST